VEKAKRHKLPFDPIKNDWTFKQIGKFIDTVTFADKEFKRVYYSVYQCRKEGASADAPVEYSNVDKVIKF
jgi:hypothetical protein